MTVVRRNIVANIVGRSFSALLQLFFVPLYVKLLGAEAYGLIGFFITLQMIFFFADIGLSGTFTREIARLSVMKDKVQQMRELCRTLEIIFLFVGLLITLVVAAMSGFIARQWVNPDSLSTDTISNAVFLMGIIIGLRFPFLIYQGGLFGLQRQMLLNILLMILGLLRGLGILLLLMFVDSSIKTFFEWQVLMSVLQLIVARILMWRSLPHDPGVVKFNLSLMRPLMRFATGMAAITLSSIILMQMDKLILSKMLSLKMFGYYVLAGVVAEVPLLLSGPVHNAVYPRLTQLVETKKKSELIDLYHRTCQLIAVSLIPVGLFVAFFSEELMFLWTGSVITTQNTYLILRVLVIGSTLLGLMSIPYALQLAFGWTKLAFHVNIVAILFLAPLLIWLTARYGALGACYVWVILNLGYFFGTIQLMHQRILPGEKWRWYRDSVGKPLFSALLIIVIGRLLFDGTASKLVLIANICGIIFLAMCAAAMGAPLIRNMVLTRLLNIKIIQILAK